MVADFKGYVSSRLHHALIGASVCLSLAIAPGWVGSAAAVPLASLASLAQGGSGVVPPPTSADASDPGDEARAEQLVDIHDRYVAVLDGYLELRNLIAPVVAGAGLSGPKLVDAAASIIREHVDRERKRAHQELQEELGAAAVEVSWDGEVTAADVAESNEFLRTFIEEATGYLEAVLASADGGRPVAEGLRAVGSFLDAMQAFDEALQDEG
jgi:hypothetical protein